MRQTKGVYYFFKDLFIFKYNFTAVRILSCSFWNYIIIGSEWTYFLSKLFNIFMDYWKKTTAHLKSNDVYFKIYVLFNNNPNETFHKEIWSEQISHAIVSNKKFIEFLRICLFFIFRRKSFQTNLGLGKGTVIG